MSPSSLGRCHLKKNNKRPKPFCWNPTYPKKWHKPQEHGKKWPNWPLPLKNYLCQRLTLRISAFLLKSNQEGEYRCTPSSVPESTRDWKSWHFTSNIFILSSEKKLWPKLPPNLTEEPYISSHLWRDWLTQGLLPRQLADECHWCDSVCACVSAWCFWSLLKAVDNQWY